MSYRDHLDRIAAIVDPHWMSREKAEAVGQLCDKLRPQRVLEIGTWQGTGTCYLAAFARDYDGHVATIDLPWTATTGEKIKVLAETQLTACGLHNATVIRRADGAEGWLREYFAAPHRAPLDLVYLDSGHDWKSTAAQLLMSWSALRHGGWVIMDDLADKTWPDVGLVWRSLAETLGTRRDRYEVQATPHSRLGFLLRR